MKAKFGSTKSRIISQKYKNASNTLHLANLSIDVILDEKYEIKREISRGGMGIVYEAYDNTLHRQVAIKIILGNKIDALQLKRFQNAQYELGMIYAKGLYNDLDTARLWWRKVANQGHEKAKKKLNSIKK